MSGYNNGYDDYPDQVWRRPDPKRDPLHSTDILKELTTEAELDLCPPQLPPAMVAGHIHAGETGLLVGRPKVGKSRMALQLALSLSRGKPFLNQAVTGKKRVLVLDLENRAHTVHARIKVMRGDEGLPLDAYPISIHAPNRLAQNQLSITDEVGFYQLQQVIGFATPDLIIIDTWRLLSGVGDENRAEHVVGALTRLSRLRELNPEMVMLLLHHLRKKDLGTPVTLRQDPYTWVEAVSGHHALVGHVDFCWGLDREVDDGDEKIVFGGVSRNAASSVILLEEDPDTLLFTPVEARGRQMQEEVLTQRENQFWNVAQTLGSFRYKDLLETCQTTNRKCMSSMLTKAQNQGRLRKVPIGGYEGYEVIGGQGQPGAYPEADLDTEAEADPLNEETSPR